MANKVGINISGLQADKKAFESRLGGCRSITRMLTNGINAMERGLDKTRLQNVKTKMDSVLEVQHTLERYYEWAIRVIDECIEKYQSVDSILEKHADDMYDKNGNIVNPSIGSKTGNSNSDQEALKPNLSNVKDYNGTTYHALNYENNIMSQNSYDGYEFGYGDYNDGCTATSWCMGLSMMDGEKYDPTSSEMWINGEGATFKGQGESIWGDEASMLKEAYKQLMNGKPSVFYAEHYFSPTSSAKCPHAVTIVGVSSTANPDALTMNDFLVVDPWGGVTKTLAEVNYCGYPGYSRLITYQ